MNLCPATAVALLQGRRNGSRIVDFDIGAQSWGHAGKALLRQAMEQLRIGIVAQVVAPQRSLFSDVEIVVRQFELARTQIPQQTAIAVECGVEAGFEHLFGLRGWGAEGKNLERPDF